MSNSHLVSLMHTLSLSGMVKAFEIQSEQPQMFALGFEERLSILLEAEANTRENKRITRLTKAAKMRQHQAALEDVHYLPSRGLDKALIADLSTCQWIDKRQNLVITGATGTGKSWLACAFGKQACRHGYPAIFLTATHLYEQITAANMAGTLPKLRTQLIKNRLLIIDDFGIGGVDIQLGPILLDIIDQHALQGSLIITSQFPTEKWYDLFNDPTIADAILDRVVHKSHFLKLKGESQRKGKLDK
ncbi:IS21-like element helper ATPase IstB [Leclercia adecarboxylata]|uniref:IS21-like element helper ATPase IstB n=1 Tax=Leclercia adecarboxylata TaxID=83655 RepID=UPI00247467C7|nr:IS21-like element helper ATPase IstB [Leclercia adecarboxylata]MDH6164791.1 DNA replication protein DnaC [Leclercia adecarboxylata]